MKTSALNLLMLPALMMPAYLNAQVVPPKAQILLNVDLFLALKKGDPLALKRALDQGADPNARDPKGLTPLHACANHGLGWMLAEQLLAKGAKVNPPKREKNDDVPSPLQAAVNAWNPRLAQALIKAGADPKAAAENGETLIHLAAKGVEGRTFQTWQDAEQAFRETLDLLLGAGLDLQAKAGASTALDVAFNYRQCGSALVLLERGAQLNRNHHGEISPIETALQAAHPGLLKALLERKASLVPSPKRPQLDEQLCQSIQSYRPSDQAPADPVACLELLKGAGLDIAACTGRTNLLQRMIEANQITGAQVVALLEMGLPVDSPDKEGFTALHLAIQKRREGTASLLIERGADVKSRSGHCPMVMAAEQDMAKLVKQMLDRGAPVNDVDSEGRTALMVAPHGWAFPEHSLVKLLLDSGADPLKRDAQGRSLLHHAVHRVLEPVSLEAILSKGIALDDRDRRGRTPLMEAAAMNPNGCTWLLRKDSDATLCDHSGRNALMILCGESRTNSYDMERQIDRLHAAGARFQPEGTQPGPTALVELMKNPGQVESALRHLLDMKADPKRLDANGMSPIRAAMARTHYDAESCVATLEAKKADIDDAHLDEAMAFALRTSNLTRIQRYAQRGANLNLARTNDGLTPLMLACRTLNTEAMECLILRHASVKARDKAGQTPLHQLGADWGTSQDIDLAAWKQALNLLLKAGADLNALDDAGESLIFRTLRRGERGRELARIEVASGANIHLANRKGETPFDVLAGNWTRSEDQWTFMKALGFDPNARLACGHTLLIHFILQKRTDDALWLLDHGTDLRMGDSNESLPLAYAAANKNDALVLKLIQLGAPISSRDKDGDTPMMQSLIEGSSDQAQLLLKHGAKPEDAFRGDYKAWKKLLAANPPLALKQIQEGDEREIAKAQNGLPGIWTYGLLAAAVLSDDLDTLQRAKTLGLNFEAMPRKTPKLCKLAEVQSSKEVRAYLEKAVDAR